MGNDWLDLDGKTVVVTGGSSGIGLAIVREFLSHGANCAVGDINCVPDCLKGREDVLYVKTDVTSKQSADALVEAAVKRFGRLDVMVNNAGINIPSLLVDEAGKYELDEKVWDKVFAINVKGVFFCAQAAARIFVRNKSGVIVNISSECGLEGSEGQSVYAATKNAVNSLTRSWAKELGRHGVRVVGVAPGIIEATGLRTESYETALAYTRGITVAKLREGYASRSVTPLGRSGLLKEVAESVAYVASGRASYVSGVTLNVAGGKTRG